MRPIFCGNFEFETRQSELERLFSKYGKVERVDMKSGFAFVYYEDERDAEDAIRGLDNVPFGYERRRLSVEWAKGERGRHRDTSRSAVTANQKPTKTLFVINFDPIRTKIHDIERHFEPHGKILNVRIRRNFAFVQFETQEDATRALECTNMSTILDRVVSVEYALKDDGERRDSPPRRDFGRCRNSPSRRSPSPAFRRGGRGSPDYGRVRGSPDYGHGRARGSPDYGHARARGSPDYGRARSPVYDRYNAPYNGRSSPGFDRYRSRSPARSRR